MRRAPLLLTAALCAALAACGEHARLTVDDGVGPNPTLPEPFLTGFLTSGDRAYGRPVAVAEDRTGALLVTDDAGDRVWRVAPRP